MPEPIIRRLDQLPLALLVAIAAASVAGWWLTRGGAGRGLVNIDRAAPLDYRYTVDINAADWPELSQLPGVGEVLARRIVSYREKNGPLQTANELKRVPGIGPKTLQRVRGFLRPLPGESISTHATGEVSDSKL